MSKQQEYTDIYVGRVKVLLPQKGFGYVRVPETKEEFYFRTANLDEKINTDAIVRFRLLESRQGLIAIDLELAVDKHT